MFPSKEQNSFDGDDMVRYVHQMRIFAGPDKKIALFGDNARINKCKKVVEAAAEKNVLMAECILLFNQPYRPDLSK